MILEGQMPQKKFYRCRAHVNPLSHNSNYEFPLRPDLADWSAHYPKLASPRPTMLDIGCGFGGLSVALAKLFPDECVLAMEIRSKVTEYVRLRIEALRRGAADEDESGAGTDSGGASDAPAQASVSEDSGDVDHGYQNVAVLRSNAMKHLPNFFHKSSIRSIFFCFPDPHFKERKHRRRIVTEALLGEYAFLLRPGGKLYAITDVEALHKWHVEHLERHPAFRRLSDAELEGDVAVPAVRDATEEGKKVARAGNAKYLCVYERVQDDRPTKPNVLELLRAAKAPPPAVAGAP